MMTGIKHISAAMLAAVLVLPSCRENPAPEEADQKSYTLTLEAGFEALTKADTDPSSGSMTWSSTDRIAVGLDDGTFVPFDLVSGAGEASASFSGTVPGGKTVSGKAYYPWWDGAYSTGVRRITPPEEEAYVSDTYTPAVMSADIVPGSPLSFRHEGGIIRFVLKGLPSSAVKFTFTSDGGVYGNDSYSVTFPAGGALTRVFSVPVQTGTLAPYTISISNIAGDVLLSKGKRSSTEIRRCDLRNLTPLEVVLTNNCRIMEYNILNGMEADYDNNYDNFVAWVRSMAPDILVLTESKPFNKDKTEKSTPTYFQSRMQTRAARWGHANVAIVNKDDYPVVITSSSPITVNSTLTGANTKHGAIHVSTKGYEIVGLHLQPTLETGFDPETTNKYEYYGGKRVEEIEYILGATLSAYPARGNWIFAGDFNSYSSLEKTAKSPYGAKSAWSYPDYNGSTSAAYDVYDTIVGAGLTDVFYTINSGVFQPTMYHGCSRIDYFFASSDVYARIKRAEVLIGGFPGNYSSADETPNPSDHFPILMDIADYAFKVLDGSNTINDWDDSPGIEED